MKRVFTAAGTAIFMSTFSAAQAGPIDNACMSSERGGNRALCGCIQAVANITLNGQDQRLAAKFFAEPQMAQDVRMSKTQYHDEFWKRYEQFGATASAACS
jgi:hypothetical protein